MKDRTELFLYEDDKVENLHPLVLLRPVFDLFCGTSTFLEKIQNLYPKTNLHLLVRKELAPLVKEMHPSFSCNNWKENAETKYDALFLNGRALFSYKIPLEGKEEIFFSEDKLIGFRISSSRLSRWKFETPFREGTLKNLLKGVPKKDVKAKIAQYPWNLIEWNGGLIVQEFNEKRVGKIEGEVNEKAVIQGDPKKVSMGKGSTVGPFSLLDVRDGPIWIGRDVEIRPPTLIEGPVCIGDGTHIDGAKVRRGTSIGPGCRISGEVEETIFQGYSNKHHEGFLGHAYIGEWVNLGAGTTNSDLKNNYSEVRVILQGKEINTELIKVGCFIGDHTKTGIGSLISTGSAFGIFCNYIGGKGPSPKVVPSFSWGSEEPFASYRLEEAIKTARIVMERRGVEMTKAYQELVRKTYAKVHPRAKISD